MTRLFPSHWFVQLRCSTDQFAQSQSPKDITKKKRLSISDSHRLLVLSLIYIFWPEALCLRSYYPLNIELGYL